MLKPRRRKCKHCGDYYLPKFKSTEPCSKYECRLIELKNKTPKINKKIMYIAKKEQTDYKKALQLEVQKIARLIDYKCLCLARNIVPKQSHGGHLYNRSSNANMCFNLHNIFTQSAMSNHFQNDDGLMRDGVVRVFGQDYLDFINSLKSTPVQKYTNEDYKFFLQKARVITKQLTEWNNQLEQPRSATSRIHLRNWANTELGIYPNEFLNF